MVTTIVSLGGALHCVRAALPIMKVRRVLSFCSMSWRGNVGQANYVAAKAGIVGLTRGVALEAARDLLTAKVPARHPGDPSGIAAAAAFLCSEESRYITGVVLDVDGG